MKLLPMTAVAVLALSASLPLAAQSDAAPAGGNAEVRALPVGNLTCRALLQASGDERDLLLAIYHGYMAGKAGAESMDTVKMSFVTDKVIDHCIDNPSDRILAAFAASSSD